MKKWILLPVLFLIISACGKDKTDTSIKAEKLKEKVTEKDESALRYRMFKVDKAGVAQVGAIFKSFLEEEGMYYPRVVDFKYAAQVDNIEFDLKPTVLILFGHPKEIGVLIRENPEVAYDLPFRILVYQNDNGETWVMYADFDAMKKKYFLADNNNIIPKYKALMKKFEERLPYYLNRMEKNPEQS